MSKRIPVKAASDVAKAYGMRQVILCMWDGETSHIVTYGKTVDDCAQAAEGGNMLKKQWGWPSCNDQPSRVTQLEARVKKLEEELKGFRNL